ERLQALEIEDTQAAAAQRDEAVRLEAREQAAHGLEREPEVVPEILARHREAEVRGREAELLAAPREVEQARREPLFRRHVPEQRQLLAVAHDFAAHDAKELVLQSRN